MSAQFGSLVQVGRSGSAAETAEDLFRRLDQLNEIGAALSLEKNLDALLEKILIAAKTITRADGGTLYLVEGEGFERQLRFAIVRTASLNIALGGTTGNPIPFYPIHLYRDDELAHGATETQPAPRGSEATSRKIPNNSMVAAYAALHGETVNIADAYTEEGFDFSGTRRFDQKTGYRSKSFLTVPMKNHEGEPIGVLQLLNSQQPQTGDIVAFSPADQRLAESLASQAAIALTNRALINQLEQLFESFVELINAAIDEKSPYTGGHCQRVPMLTMMLAEAVSGSHEGPLAQFQMSEHDRYELKIAGMLHDCGKITTPVHIVDKATKLETIFDRINLLDTRFEILKRDAEIAAMNRKLELARDARVDEITRRERMFQIEDELRDAQRQLDDDRRFLRRCNIGGETMSDEDRERVMQIGLTNKWCDPAGNTANFLTEDEVKNLTIQRGTLTGEEREVINHHIVSTIKMLEALPWPKHLHNVPEYSGGHHERIDGKGYPRGLKGAQMSVQARIMGIADIFEALTAKDRAYKRGKTLSESLQILGRFSLNGHIDPDLFDIFIRKRVYLEYAEQFLDPEQIDVVDEAKVPGYTP